MERQPEHWILPVVCIPFGVLLIVQGCRAHQTGSTIPGKYGGALTGPHMMAIGVLMCLWFGWFLVSALRKR